MAIQTPPQADLIVIGGGAAGLFGAIHAGRSGARVLVLEGARTLGAKVLVAGGGRCNVTHHAVDEKAFAGSTQPAIRKVLGHFTVEDTIAFFHEQGVSLKREETGKLFPTTDRARSILDALLNAAEQAHVVIKFPRRVDEIHRTPDGFIVRGPWGEAHAPRVLLATGGKALPKSGSDGAGYEFAKHLGHSITPEVHPALVPLILPGTHPLRSLPGIAVPAAISVKNINGKVLHSFTNSLLFTHFGLSGPAALDISRYWRMATLADSSATLHANLLPDLTYDVFEAQCIDNKTSTPLAVLRPYLPERCARALCEIAGVDPTRPLCQLSKIQRRSFVASCTDLHLPIEGDRGFTHAEVTMGGIPLKEVRLETMASRICPGLSLAGEILDVDGRIGGFNFQWAWATGYIAGRSIQDSD
jgi:predicted Rossmann fold flavoprotein